MKHLILAAGFALIAAPAFAGSAHDLNVPKSANKSVTITDSQMGGYNQNSDSAIAKRNANLRRNAAERSDNARAAWQGSPHYY
jgi:hypothetical protein